jgi:hypothetical protein
MPRISSQYNIAAQVKQARRPQAATTNEMVWAPATVWAAAAHAHRINQGEYLREPEYGVDAEGMPTLDIVRHPNRVIITEAFIDQSRISDSDRELGSRAQDWHGKNLMMRALKGTLSDFDQALQRAVTVEAFSLHRHRTEIAVIASQIRAYEQGVMLEEAMSGILREPLADIGAKVDANITVVKSVYSENYGVWFITAVTESRHAVFFSYRDRWPNGERLRVRGTVKAHRDLSTQLNRVKIV